MSASRHAQAILVSALTFGLALGPAADVRAAALGPASDTATDADAPASDDEPDGTPETAADADADAASPDGDDGAPTESESADGEPAEGEPAEGAPAEGEPPAEKEPPAASEDVPAPDGGESSEVITVRPGPVTSLSADGEPTGDTPSREAVVDPRRRFTDQRIIFRASLLAFGAAGLAFVPTVVGLQQGAYARRVLSQLDTPSEAGARAEVRSYEQSMNRMAIISGAVSATSLLGGFVMLGVGLRGSGAPRRTTVAPVVGGGTAGVMLRGRF